MQKISEQYENPLSLITSTDRDELSEKLVKVDAAFIIDGGPNGPGAGKEKYALKAKPEKLQSSTLKRKELNNFFKFLSHHM